MQAIHAVSLSNQTPADPQPHPVPSCHIRKIKQHLGELNDTLSPVLALVGSPNPDKVRSAIETGLVPKEAFTGAFTKTTRHIVSVAKMRMEKTQ